MKLTLTELRSAISESAHSEFYLAGSGLNERLLLDVLNKLIAQKEADKDLERR